MRVLMIITTTFGERQNRSLGLGQVVETYYLFRDSGAEVVIASSQGGNPPIRNGRERSKQASVSLQRFQNDRGARDAISDTLKIEQIYPEDFDSAICMGVLEDSVHSGERVAVISLIKALSAAGKPVAVVPGNVELASEETLHGLFISCNEACAPSLVVQTVLAAVSQPQA